MRSPALAAALLVLCGAPLYAASPGKPSCKKIRDAVWANKTLDQIMKEFDTDAETVMKCTQKPGKRKAAPKAKSQKSSQSSAKSGKSSGSSATSKSKSSQPSTRKQSAPHSRPLPPRMP